MPTVHVAFLWHQHQPYYKDRVTGRYAMPWVRLHGIKDYWGMPAVVEAVPGMRVTVNLVPSLVAQLLDYAAGTASDRWLDLCRRPADGLAPEEAAFILNSFFNADRQTMIEPHPRYRELHRRRRFGHKSASAVLPDFTVQDLRDLQVWSVLAWFHPLAVERNDTLKALLAKDRGFTEDDKAGLLAAQEQVLAEVVPLHRRLAEAGTLDLTTTPYYHPILPLLVDMESAREAMPGVTLPAKRRSVPDDARAQLENAVEFHTVTFGRRPRGMWPSEGSVSDGIIPLVVEAGLKWVASDEEVLAQSLGRRLQREATGSVCADAEVLYRAYVVGANGAELAVVFRDHTLSDLIGFQYRFGDPEKSADDFLSRLLHIRQHTSCEECLVPVILDGENAWEHYPDQGVEFLRALYRRLVETPGIEPVLVSDFLESHPPTERLPRLAAGSWINHNFAVWVGHEEDNRAWDYVFTTRDVLERRTREAGEGARRRPPFDAAWEELYAAEGSDWFWWYGDDHSSGQDELFDLLFRTHLKNVYALLGEAPPVQLDVPVLSAAKITAYAHPKSFLDVRVCGRDSNYFEWLDAGHFAAASRYGTMHPAAAQLVTDLYFGFNEQRLFLKLSTAGALKKVLGPAPVVEVRFRQPAERTLRVAWSDGSPPAVTLTDESGRTVPARGAEAALDLTFELGIEFAVLGIRPGDRVQFYVEVHASEGLTERIPETGGITFPAPSADFEQINWQA